MTLTLTAPAPLTATEQERRSRLIQTLGAALRDDPTVINLRGKMTGAVPRYVWLFFSFTDDHTAYRLTLPNHTLTATLWMQGIFQPWEPLETYALPDYAAGDALWADIKTLLYAPAMDAIHRWLEEPVWGGAP